MPQKSDDQSARLVAKAIQSIQDWKQETALRYRNRGLPPDCYLDRVEHPQPSFSNPADCPIDHSHKIHILGVNEHNVDLRKL